MSQIFNKKICLLGEFGVGKTSLVERFVYNRFDDSYLSTLGVKVSEKLMPPIQIKNGLRQFRFMIWDIAGAEDGKVKHDNYWIGASGALVVADLTRPETFEFIRPLAEYFRSLSGNVPIVLIGNKTDLIPSNSFREIQNRLMATGDQMAVPCLFTSAKTGDQVEASFQKLAGLLTG